MFQKKVSLKCNFRSKRESICDSVSNNKLNFSKETNLTWDLSQRQGLAEKESKHHHLPTLTLPLNRQEKSTTINDDRFGVKWTESWKTIK